MIEIETGRVGTRKNPVPALSRKIKHLEVRVGFLQQVKDLIGRLTSELQHARSSSATRERELRRQLEKKQTTIMDQGLRIRNYEKDAAKHALQQARSDASMSLVLSNVMDGMGSDRGSVTLPSGGSLVSADGSLVADRIEPHSMSNGAVSVVDKPGLTDLQRGPAIDVPGTMDPTPSMLEESLKYVGGLPPMGAALTNPSPHLVPPHQLPRGRAGAIQGTTGVQVP